MERTRMQRTEEQFRHLKALAREEERSAADLVSQSVAQDLVRRSVVDRAELVLRARSLVGRYRSGIPDLAADHDRYLDDAFDS